MRSTMLTKGLVASCSLTVALAVGACADANDDLNDRPMDAAPDAAPADAGRMQGTAGNAAGQAGAVMTLTGCLQKQDGIIDNFILTQANQPAGAVGTSGAPAGSPERDQLQAARRSYELDSDDDDQFEKLVGKQVRVTGTIDEASNLNQRSDDRPAAGDIKARDLARVNVQTVMQVAESCGSAR